MERIIQIADSIDCSTIYEELSHPLSGGICVFIGTVRQQTNNEEVTSLYFESYESMAISEIEKIIDEAAQRWTLNKVIVKHALGNKNPKEPVVIVGASSAHRDACFEACRFLIDTLKQKVPIWKKEFFKNKSVWVSAHP
ncbi:MAG: molybdenum cofactor biosynthesis protein MoaE [Flavobacteriaceae bacterium]|nr:molybdenum cofactor biosynthesis protein MoaE [Flavobacteriaceae bacterium]MDZ4147172.1 molybdenum cofactor biosynthesis protein MoaE [Flavobacteriaceae bacterium]